MIHWGTVDVFHMQRSQLHIDPPKAVLEEPFWDWACVCLTPSGCVGAMERWGHIHKLCESKVRLLNRVAWLNSGISICL